MTRLQRDYAAPSTATNDRWPPTPGQLFYQGLRGDKGGKTRTGVMATWRELCDLSPDVARAYEAAGAAAHQYLHDPDPKKYDPGAVASQCYAVYCAARAGRVWDGTHEPSWDGLHDQRAWTAAAQAVRLG